MEGAKIREGQAKAGRAERSRHPLRAKDDFTADFTADITAGTHRHRQDCSSNAVTVQFDTQGPSDAVNAGFSA